MVTAKTILLTIVVTGACLIAPMWVQAAPATEPNLPLFVGAGGPYVGVVGEPITFNAYLASWVDANTVSSYCWDWYMDGRADCAGPTRTHTWHSAYSGTVNVHIFDDDGNFAAADARVTVVGPETVVSATLNSNADLHIYGPRLRHLGPDYDANNIEMDMPGGSFVILDENGNEVPFTGCIPAEGFTQQAAFLPYDTGPFAVELQGTGDGPFELTLSGIQDGVCVAEQVYTGEIFAGETISLNLSVCCQKGAMDMDCGPLQYCPQMEVSPGSINLYVEPSTVVTVPLTIREGAGLRPMCAVGLSCTDLTAPVYKIKGSDITFDVSGFDVPAGGEQVVNMTIPIPHGFLGTASGSLVITCSDNVAKTISVKVSNIVLHPPVASAGGPYQGTVGSPVIFKASGSYDPDGTITEFGWDWNGDGQYQGFKSPQCTHTFDEAFEGTVTLRLTDNDGLVAYAQANVKITEP